MRVAIFPRTSATAVSLLLLFGYPAALCAQPTQAPTLQDILKRLQSNLDHYDAGVPNLFCDEQAISSQMEPGTREQKTIIDSVFRLRRTAGRNHTTALVESRQAKSVDGKPATSQDGDDIDAPTVLSGLFEGGLAVVSLTQAACMKYTLQPSNNDRYVVRFATAFAHGHSAGCFLQEKSKGQVFIDPASMQVTHLEITTPHHTITDADDSTSRVVGRRELTVDYAPVPLGSETFWMPSAITMRVTSSGFRMITWSLQATYRNYHRLEVTSRILPGSEAPAP